MKLGQTTSENNLGHEADGANSVASLLKIVNEELVRVEDTYNNLLTDYEDDVYEKFEKKFIEIRNKFKGKLKDITDEHYSYITRSENRKNAVEKILNSSTAVAERFQEARENQRLNRPSVTNSLEDLKYDLKNLKHLLEQ
jgi:hypothetical protein